VGRSDQNDYIDWDARREGYIDTRSKFVPVVEIPKHSKKKSGQGSLLSIRLEERLGSLLTAGGMGWLIYAATLDFNRMWQMRIMPPGPIEVCALGILLWLHAKWRRSIRVN
jgi:hypothetical protein